MSYYKIAYLLSICVELFDLSACVRLKGKKYNHQYCFHSQGQPISTGTKTSTGEPFRSSLITKEFSMSYWPAVKYFLLVGMILEVFSQKFVLASDFAMNVQFLLPPPLGLRE